MSAKFLRSLLAIAIVSAFLLAGMGALVLGASNGAGLPGSQSGIMSKLGMSATGHQTLSNNVPTGFTQTGNLPAYDTVTVTFFVPFNNMQTVTSMARAVSSPGSASYHKFMTSAQITSRFANSQRFNSLMNYLTNSGFTISSTSMESAIVATGTVSQIQQYLGLQVGVYSNGTASYYSAYGTTSIKGVSVYASSYDTLFLSHPPTLVNQSSISSLQHSVGKVGQVFPPFVSGQYLPTTLQSVYDATGMYARGYNGSGTTIGILDFYGDPFIQSQLTYFDQLTGLPAPPSFNIVPIYNYQPGMGIATGWAGEISLDVESAHTMAPGASITLYIANAYLPLFYPIEVIDSQGTVQTLSQSFSIPEAALANAPAIALLENVYVTDFFYQIGALEGITFMASTGDVGGSGYSGGPLGTAGYPSTSAFVTAVGGTSTYLDFNSGGRVTSYNETAWSNYGMIPAEVNYGGSTGGISTLIPRPWYQANISSPSGYAVQGRMVPDISFEAAVFPGMIFVFPGNVLEVSGGTSEASPLLAGLLALTVQFLGPVGFLNPIFYDLGTNSTLYPQMFHPVTFGYNIPWTAHYGYNLVTGFGSLNITAFTLGLIPYASTLPSQLSISVVTENALPIPSTPYPEYLNGTNILVNATISLYAGGPIVPAGTFNAYLVSLFGLETQVALVFNPAYGTWMGNLTLPVTDTGYGGLSNVVVNGSYSGTYGSSSATVYVGYYLYFTLDSSVEPYTLDPLISGLFMQPQLTLLNGTGVSYVDPTGTLSLYGQLNNTYYFPSRNTFGFVNLNNSTGQASSFLTGNFALGPALLYINDTGAFFPFFNGATTFGSLILGSTGIEPGAVAPGQSVFVEPTVTPPVNYYDYNVHLGSVVNISLISPSGQTVSEVTTVAGMVASLPVPASAPSGLYTVLLNTSYDSFLANAFINSTAYGQIFVSRSASTMSVSLSTSTIVEGQTVQVNATILDGTGAPIRYGVYSAVLYPENLQSDAYYLSEYENIPLYYDSTTSQWEGTVTMPSGANAGVLTSVLAGLPDYSGSYFMNIYGLSSAGTPTDVSVNAGTAFALQSPLVISLQSSLSTINSEIATMTTEIHGLNVNTTQMSAELSSLQAQLLALSAEATYLNQTLHINTTALQTQITNTQTQLTNLQHELSSTTTAATTARNNTSTAYILGIVGAVLGAVGLIAGIVALSRKPRAP